MHQGIKCMPNCSLLRYRIVVLFRIKVSESFASKFNKLRKIRDYLFRSVPSLHLDDVQTDKWLFLISPRNAPLNLWQRLNFLQAHFCWLDCFVISAPISGMLAIKLKSLRSTTFWWLKFYKAISPSVIPAAVHTYPCLHGLILGKSYFQKIIISAI